MTRIEKTVIVLVTISLISVVVIAYQASQLLADTGGIRGVIVNVGKEVKQIGQEIAED